ncbi:protein FAM177A1 [Girardinichthys multiradiatus]|uniref:protein FAM177A1 n=1 Tax=Girardinichthys multiradiatus TaxID=208333 RepID=UPI001FACB78B|nr:protein FAM177A1 [Girardinichthys multiradiatus]XP_047244278.1 protein FAM177A1 [Girardinichthys multiradiatus]
MNTSSHQEVSAQIHDTEFGGPPLQKQKRIIYFSSGETLELEDPEEDEAEEQPSRGTPFKEPGGRPRMSFKNVAIVVGRMSLLACDFLGQRLAGALGLNAAKYQYAIDQYHREHKITENDHEDQAENIHSSPGLGGSHYGATGDVRSPSDPQESCDDKHRDKGCQNRAYQDDKDD